MDKEHLEHLTTATNIDSDVIVKLIDLFDDEELKHPATRALGNAITQLPSAIPTIRDKLRNSSCNTQYYIILSLRYAENAKVFVPDLVTFLSNENENLREITANTLGEIHDLRPVQQLLQAMYQDPSKNVRYYAMHALCDLKDTTIISQLIELVQSSNHEIRMYSIHILGKMCEDAAQAIPYIFPYLQDEDSKMVAVTATALGNMGDERARNVLQEISQTGSPSYVLSARRALQKLDGKR